MGVDSGFPDFRGPQGFWKAYPHLESRGKDFYAMASPAAFVENPELAWGFYGHRQALYRDTEPHEGFAILLDWGQARRGGYFVFTSNVDGHFQRAGFDDDRVFECHGNINTLQCLQPCSDLLWPLDAPVSVPTASAPLPSCPSCGGLARPNVLMFGDAGWISDVSAAQHDRYREWLEGLQGRSVAVIEIGAGLAVPTVRMESEALVRTLGATLVRINPRDPGGPAGTLSLPLGGLDGLRRIAAAMR